jgi:hypothetical protein
MVLRAGIAAKVNGNVHLELSIGGKPGTNSWHFSTTGEAESLYALRLL